MPESLISALQSDALAREIEQQIESERRAVAENAKREAGAVVAQARRAARRQMHQAIQELRREAERRLSRARAQAEAGERAHAQARVAEAVRAAWPLLRDALATRWANSDSRLRWVKAAAAQAAMRLRANSWVVEHPLDWNAIEQTDFLTALGKRGGADIAFKADQEIAAGLRIRANQAVLDATPHGLLADHSTISALLLAEIGVAP